MITRADMTEALALNPNSPTKTFVIEAHAKDSPEFLRSMAGSASVESTADAYLYRLILPEGDVWVDQIDSRFWSFHTDISMKAVSVFLRNEVERHRELDWLWLPSDHLRNVWPGSVSRQVRTSFTGSRFVGPSDAARDLRVQLSGQDADRLLDYISENPSYRSSVSFDSVQETLKDNDLGHVEEAVSRMGRFVVSGDSFEFHSQFVRSVVRRYKQLVTLCETKAVHYSEVQSTSNGRVVNNFGRIAGGPITVKFSRPIENIEHFMTELLSSKHPYRLWGVPELDDDWARVDAVDLHIGSRIGIEVGQDWMRVYLSPETCGNTVARLVANLQHTFDSALRFVDPQLQDALKGNSAALAASRN